MQKRWLKDFEFSINPNTWNTAQDLVAEGRVKSIREVEKHFWVALVEDEEGRFEVEMMLTPHKIKAFTCECWSAGRRLMCAHVAASLLKVRQFLEKKTEEKKELREQPAKSEPGRLTVQAVLEVADPEALLDFVRQYARRDRDFALALKTWFAGALDPGRNPFVQLLDSAIPRQGVASLREPDFRRLRKTLDDLGRQLRAATAEQNFPLAFQIATAVLQRIGPLTGKFDGEKRAQLVQYLQNGLERLAELPPERLSPELAELCWTAVFDQASRGLFPQELDRDLVRFIVPATSDPARFEAVRHLFDHTPFPSNSLVLHLFTASLANRGQVEGLIRVLADYLDKPALLYETVFQLHYLHLDTAALQAGEYFLPLTRFSAAQRRSLEDLLLHIADKTGDHPRKLALLRRRFLQFPTPELLQGMRLSAGDNWPDLLEELIADLRRENKNGPLAQVLAETRRFDDLKALLQLSGDFALFQQFEFLLLEVDKDFVRDQYAEVLSAYLRQHFGRQASAWVRDRLSALLARSETDLVLELIRELCHRFEDRHTLPDELAELFPKSKRKAILAT